MQRYESYKYSGVEWLGETPKHWEVKKMKFLFKDTSIKNKPDETLLSVTQNRGVIPRDWLEERTVMPSGSLDTFKFIERDDFAISLRSFEGGLEICHHDGIISPAYTVLKYNKKILNNGYYKYLFKCQSFISEMQTSIVGIREGKNISYEELKYSFLPIPSCPEQQKIALYLDDKTAKIYQAISLAEKQIELLKEHKQILIQSAVTKGLDSNVAMKDSGVEWIGEVPAHWEIKKLKFVLVLSNNKEESKNSGKRYIGMENVESFTGKINDSILSAEGVANSFYKNEILFGKLRPYLTKSYLANFDGICSTEFLVYKTTKNINNHFALSIFLSHGFIDTVNSSTYGSKMPRANSEFLSNMLLPIPPLDEQQKIVQYLDEKTTQIDHAISLKQQHIEKLKEYKNVLINDVVTGKVKV